MISPSGPCAPRNKRFEIESQAILRLLKAVTHLLNVMRISGDSIVYENRPSVTPWTQMLSYPSLLFSYLFIYLFFYKSFFFSFFLLASVVIKTFIMIHLFPLELSPIICTFFFSFVKFFQSKNWCAES